MPGTINIASGYHLPGAPKGPNSSLAFQLMFVAVSFLLFWAAVRFDPSDLRELLDRVFGS